MILPILFVGANLMIPVADGVPTYNVRPSCEAAANGSIGLRQEIDACLKTEQDARNQVASEWNSFNPADRSTCAGLSTTGGQSTYTELLTCLEMMQMVRKLPKEPDVTIGGRAR
jgi:hypothetical protein